MRGSGEFKKFKSSRVQEFESSRVQGLEPLNPLKPSKYCVFDCTMVELDRHHSDRKGKRSFFLNRPYQGLYVKPGMWRDLEDFSSGAVCMVLASDMYLASDYIRDYGEFLRFRVQG